MNTVAAYRQSTVLLAGGPRPVFDKAVVVKRRTFTAVDWPAFKEKCEEERNWESTNDDLSIPDSYIEPEYAGFREGLKRICTVFPFADAQWVVAVFFFTGSLSFVVAAFFKIIPVVLPESVFEGQITLAMPIAIMTGATVFLVAGNLALITSFNSNGGSDPEGDLDKLEEQAPAKYSPPLLEKKEWTWCPPWAELKSVYLPNPAFQAGLISTIGGFILSSSAIAGLPGLLDPLSRKTPECHNLPTSRWCFMSCYGRIAIDPTGPVEMVQAKYLFFGLACFILEHGRRDSAVFIWRLYFAGPSGSYTVCDLFFLCYLAVLACLLPSVAHGYEVLPSMKPCRVTGCICVKAAVQAVWSFSNVTS